MRRNIKKFSFRRNLMSVIRKFVAIFKKMMVRVMSLEQSRKKSMSKSTLRLSKNKMKSKMKKRRVLL